MKVLPVVIELARKGYGISEGDRTSACLSCNNAIWYKDLSKAHSGNIGVACYCERLHYLTYGLCSERKCSRAFVGDVCGAHKPAENLTDYNLEWHE